MLGPPLGQDELWAVSVQRLEERILKRRTEASRKEERRVLAN